MLYKNREKERKRCREKNRRIREKMRIGEAGVIVNCLNCGRRFGTMESRLKKGKGKFCSRDCFYKDFKKRKWSGISPFVKGHKFTPTGERHWNWRNAKLTSFCRKCNKEFKYFQSNSTGIYCSRECADSCPILREERRIKLIRSYGNARRKSPLNKLIRSSGAYAIFKKEILKIIGYKCEECWSKIKLDIHHFIPLSFLIRELVLTNNPIVFEREDVKILCRECHKKTNNWGSLAINSPENRLMKILINHANKFGINPSEFYQRELSKIISHYESKLSE